MIEDSEAIQKLEEAIRDKNYILAVRIAKSIAKPEEEIRELQLKAIKQFILEFRNPHGVASLAEEFNLSGKNLNRILSDILQEAREKNIIDKKQFDIKTMRYLNIEEWIKEYFKIE